MTSDRRGGLRPSPAPTVEQARMLKLLASHAKLYQRTQNRIDELWRERVDLYAAARELKPPLTFRQIAEVFGITEAAVMQMHARGNRASG